MPGRAAFSLVELLAVIALLAVLATLLFPTVKTVFGKNEQTAALYQMKQIGVAFHLYAGDNDLKLPGRVDDQDKWPRLLAAYLKDDLRVYASPGDPENYLKRGADPLANAANNTSFIMNGYNDLGAFEDPTVEVRLVGMPPSQVILLGTPKTGSRHFYMDILEGRHGNHVDVLNLKAFGDGSNYLFTDGSARFIKANDYDHRLWLVDKDFEIPGYKES